jgi:tRNA A-37 threonylcarbamoyl transferase component Bud32
MDREHNESVQNGPWRDYFLNRSGDCILQGLVLDEIVKTRHICDSDVSNPDIARSGREGLETSHERGVLHGDVKNRLNAKVSASGNRVIWMDFSMGETNANISDTSFAMKASREIRHWNRYFKSALQDQSKYFDLICLSTPVIGFSVPPRNSDIASFSPHR